MFLLVPGSLVLGFFFSDTLLPFVKAVPYLFAYVTLTMAIGCGLEQLKAVTRKPGVMIGTLLIAHIVSPLAAYLIGKYTFGPDSPYVVGLVLFALIPLGVSTVFWVGMSGGSVPLILAMVVLDSALSPLVVPAGIKLLFHTNAALDTGHLAFDLAMIVVAPTVIGVLLCELTRGRMQPAVQPYAAPLSKLCFIAVVALNAAAIAPYAAGLKADMLKLVPISVMLVALCYAFGFISAAPLRNREKQVTVSYATGMRNISLGIVLAIGYFSPLTAVPVMLTIMIQQPVATLYHYALQKLHKSKAGKANAMQVR